MVGDVPREAVTQADNGRQVHLVNLLFHSLGGPFQDDRPASRPSPDPIVRGDRFQNKKTGGKDSVEASLSDCGVGVSSLSELISSVINDGNVRFTSDINAGNLHFPSDINVDGRRRGKMCVHHSDEVRVGTKNDYISDFESFRF